jgi:peptidoglycan/xylan/chitin deacetylase (PgdA/CDA1 family)
MILRNTIKTVLAKSRILSPLKSLHQNKIVIFNYHRIKDINKPLYFDETVFGPDATRFRQEMEWIKKETRVLSEEELIEIVYSKKPVKELCSMVTFDDGYRDNFDIAYPILKELNIPAIFFIPTEHLSKRQVGWWDIVAYLIKKTGRKNFTFQNIEYNITDPKLLIKKFIRELKSIESSDVNNYLNNLSKALDQDFPDIELQSSELMTWDQIRLMSDNGMTIGTHGHDHSIFSRQDGTTLRAQLETSIHILESVIDKKIKSVAYPVGGYHHFNQETKTVSKDIDLKLGFSFLTGFNLSDDIDPFDVKRISLQPEWINLDIPLAFPSIFLKAKDSEFC